MLENKISLKSLKLNTNLQIYKKKYKNISYLAASLILGPFIKYTANVLQCTVSAWKYWPLWWSVLILDQKSGFGRTLNSVWLSLSTHYTLHIDAFCTLSLYIFYYSWNYWPFWLSVLVLDQNQKSGLVVHYMVFDFP